MVRSMVEQVVRNQTKLTNSCCHENEDPAQSSTSCDKTLDIRPNWTGWIEIDRLSISMHAPLISIEDG